MQKILLGNFYKLILVNKNFSNNKKIKTYLRILTYKNFIVIVMKVKLFLSVGNTEIYNNEYIPVY